VTLILSYFQIEVMDHTVGNNCSILDFRIHDYNGLHNP